MSISKEQAATGLTLIAALAAAVILTAKVSGRPHHGIERE